MFEGEECVYMLVVMLHGVRRGSTEVEEECLGRTKILCTVRAKMKG